MGINGTKLFFFSLAEKHRNSTHQLRLNNLTLITQENKARLCKSKRRDSRFRIDFDNAVSAMDTEAHLADLLINPNPIDMLSQDTEDAPSISLDEQQATEAQEGFKFSVSRAVLKRIPQGSRDFASTALADCLDAILSNPECKNSWSRLFGFAGACFGKAKRGGKKSGTLAKHVNSQIRNFTQGIVNEYVPKKSEPRPPNIAALVATKIGTGDIRGAVRILASDDKVMEINEETIEKLEERHPPPHPDTNFDHSQPEPGSPQFIATSNDVKLAIASFKNGSGGGPDGLLGQHLKDMTTEKLGGTATRLLEKLAGFCNLVFRGGLPEFVLPIFYGANLIALSKKEGGVRPIAVGNTPRRLVGKVAMSMLKGTCQTHIR